MSFYRINKDVCVRILKIIGGLFGLTKEENIWPDHVWGQTDVGRGRESNEDCFAVTPDGNLLVVADGMGGHLGGEVASATAVKSIRECLAAHLEALDAGEDDDVLQYITECVLKAHDDILLRAQEDAALKGMGSTAVVAVLRESKLFLCNVGDSRAYMIDAEGIKLLSRDHSVVMSQVEAGKMTMLEARQSEMKNNLTQALGGFYPLEPFCTQVTLQSPGWLLLCSDGLWDMLGDGQIEEIAARYDKARDFCQELVRAANAAGGEDNITAVAVRY